MSESGFFTAADISSDVNYPIPELLHESPEGWSQIYLIDKDGRFRVLKVLKEGFRGDIKYETLLRKEYEIGYKLSHPGLCEVYGFLNLASLGSAIEMEWIDGDSLGDFLQRESPSRTLSENLIIQLCDALSYCHSRQVIHRDIKPGNIMITHRGHCLKIIDFGLSDSDSYSIFKSACGTRSFAAPEVIGGAQTDISSDIYSLGKVISLLNPAFRGIAAKCMRTNPQKRYRDVSSVRAAVKNLRRNNFIAFCASFALLVGVAFALTHISWPLKEYRQSVDYESVAQREASLDSALSPQSDSSGFAEAIPTILEQPLSSPETPPQQSIPSSGIPGKSHSQSQSPESVETAPADAKHPDTEGGTDAKVIDQLFRMATQILEKEE